MIPTASQVCDKIREYLGDTEVVGGQVWTNTRLLTFLSLSHQFLFGELARVNSELLSRDAHYLLQPYQTVFTPAHAKLSSIEEITQIFCRLPSQTVTVTAVATGSDYADLTCASTSGFSDGDSVDAFGFEGITGLDGEWMVDVRSGTVLRIIGVSPVGTWSSGGKVVKSAEQWGTPLEKMISTENWPTTPSQRPSRWCRQHNGVRIEGCSQEIELKLRVKISAGEISAASDSMGIDGSQLFHAAWVACQIAGTKQRGEIVNLCQPAWMSELARMKMEDTKNLQLAKRYRTQPWRCSRRRHVGF